MHRLIIGLLVPALIASPECAAQCTIDTAQTAAGIYPDTLADGTAGQPYSQDITFVLLTDTLGLTIYNYQIISMVGLPVGMTWQCNNAANGCNYNPAVSVYGCVNIGGTPVLAGTYSVVVTVVADIQLVGSQSAAYTMPLTVLPGTVSNPGFSMTNSAGCAPLTVTFSNNNPGQAAYLWDFGNGLQSTLENPPPQTYTLPGVYVVTQTVTPAVLPDYYLTAVTVNSIPNNYGAPLDDPDMYFLLRDSAGSLVYDSHPALNGVFPPHTWTLPNILLNDETYSLHVWDEDGGLFGADDDLGEITFAGWGPSGNATATVSGASGSLNVDYTIFQTPVNPLVATDTVYVFAVPAQPTVTPAGPVDACSGDTVTLACTDTLALQWYDSGIVLPGDTGQQLAVTASGTFTVTATTPEGCSATSPAVTVTVHPDPPKPTFFVNGNTFTSALTGYFLQWYLNGNAIPGATDTTYTAATGGLYHLVATDSFGCSSVSDTLVFSPVGMAPHTGAGTALAVTPNPSGGQVMVNMYLPVATAVELTVLNLVGHRVHNERLSGQAGFRSVPMDLSALPEGVYLLAVTGTGIHAVTKLVIER